MSKQKKKSDTATKPDSSVQTRDYFSQLVESIKSELTQRLSELPNSAFRAQDVFSKLDIRDSKLKILYQEVFQDLIVEGKVDVTNEGLYLFVAPETKVPRAKGKETFKETGGASGITSDSRERSETRKSSLKPGQLVGRVEHVNRGFGYVVVEGLDSDVYVDTDDLRGAIDGDEVKVQLYGRKRNGHEQGRVVEVVNELQQKVVGVLHHGGRYAFVKPDNRRIYDTVDIPLNELNGAEHGTKVIVEMVQRATRSRPALGRVTGVLGKAGDHNTEMHAILAEFGLPVEFPKEVEIESQAIPEKITQAEMKGRRDFRSVTTLTIDPADAKDFDDALSFLRLANGNIEVGVHIADVSHYILPDSPLDREAYARGTSVYLVDRTVPMLPEKLSNNLCSLRPNEDRLAFSAVFELNAKAEVIREWFGRTVIHSDRRFSYEEAQEIIENGVGEFSDELQTLNSLAKKMSDERFKRGAINFETTEVKFQLNQDGVPLGLIKKERKDAHKLIEEFMLLANKRVAEFVVASSAKKSEPNTMIYRIHEPPDQERLNTFSTFVARLGYSLDVGEGAQLAQSMNKMLTKAEGKPEQNLLETLAVRTMAKARYSTEDIGHFGLAFRRYSHFTSPIRRYPDLIAHRLLQHYLDKGASVDKEVLEKESVHCSSRERLATDAERASIKYKQVEFMSLQDEDRTYEGVISGVTEFGIFVEINETASEGLVRMNDLTDDYYEVDKENYRLVGEKTGRIFGFGDIVRVKVKETNMARRSIDLQLVGEVTSRGTLRRRSAPKSGGGRKEQEKRGKGRKRK
jgi:ribonuclease R